MNQSFDKIYDLSSFVYGKILSGENLRSPQYEVIANTSNLQRSEITDIFPEVHNGQPYNIESLKPSLSVTRVLNLSKDKYRIISYNFKSKFEEKNRGYFTVYYGLLIPAEINLWRLNFVQLYRTLSTLSNEVRYDIKIELSPKQLSSTELFERAPEDNWRVLESYKKSILLILDSILGGECVVIGVPSEHVKFLIVSYLSALLPVQLVQSIGFTTDVYGNYTNVRFKIIFSEQRNVDPKFQLIDWTTDDRQKSEPTSLFPSQIYRLWIDGRLSMHETPQFCKSIYDAPRANSVLLEKNPSQYLGNLLIAQSELQQLFKNINSPSSTPDLLGLFKSLANNVDKIPEGEVQSLFISILDIALMANETIPLQKAAEHFRSKRIDFWPLLFNYPHLQTISTDIKSTLVNVVESNRESAEKLVNKWLNTVIANNDITSTLLILNTREFREILRTASLLSAIEMLVEHDPRYFEILLSVLQSNNSWKILEEVLKDKKHHFPKGSALYYSANILNYLTHSPSLENSQFAAQSSLQGILSVNNPFLTKALIILILKYDKLHLLTKDSLKHLVKANIPSKEYLDFLHQDLTLHNVDSYVLGFLYGSGYTRYEEAIGTSLENALSRDDDLSTLRNFAEGIFDADLKRTANLYLIKKSISRIDLNRGIEFIYSLIRHDDINSRIYSPRLFAIIIDILYEKLSYNPANKLLLDKDQLPIIWEAIRRVSEPQQYNPTEAIERSVYILLSHAVNALDTHGEEVYSDTLKKFSKMAIQVDVIANQLSALLRTLPINSQSTEVQSWRLLLNNYKGKSNTALEQLSKNADLLDDDALSEIIATSKDYPHYQKEFISIYLKRVARSRSDQYIDTLKRLVADNNTKMVLSKDFNSFVQESWPFKLNSTNEVFEKLLVSSSVDRKLYERLLESVLYSAVPSDDELRLKLIVQELSFLESRMNYISSLTSQLGESEYEIASRTREQATNFLITLKHEFHKKTRIYRAIEILERKLKKRFSIRGK